MKLSKVKNKIAFAIYSPKTDTFFRSYLDFEDNIIKNFLAIFYQANFYEKKEHAQRALKYLRENQAIDAYFYCGNSKKKRKEISDSFKVVKIEFHAND